MTRALRPSQLRCPVTGKQAYVDSETALQALERIWTGEHENRHGRMPRKVYRCRECGWWHLSAGRDSRDNIDNEEA